ncbi:MAG TPA: hypothetical protein VN808_07040 [Stellaceae bacterium]|nr:hypothetical protein [Stellaceae bacterium]
MSLTYPNIVPENNLRLPDALTIKHGPAPLLSRYVMEGDIAVRDRGVRLRLCHDFEELLYVNKQHHAPGDWYRLPDLFNHEYSALTPENAYWLSGEDEHGEVVLTWAARYYYWPESTLELEARSMFYAGREQGRACHVTAADAKLITGGVLYAGSGWVRPDFRGRELMRIVPTLGRAYAIARWPVDWGISLVTRPLIDKGLAAGYGYKHVSYSITYPGSPWGDIEFAVVSVTPNECYEDFTSFLADRAPPTSLANSGSGSGLGDNLFEASVTSTSSDPVFHGNSNRS